MEDILDSARSIASPPLAIGDQTPFPAEDGFLNSVRLLVPVSVDPIVNRAYAFDDTRVAELTQDCFSGPVQPRMTPEQFFCYYKRLLKAAFRADPAAFRHTGFVDPDWFAVGPAPEVLNHNTGFSLEGGRLALVASEASGIAAGRELGHMLGLSYVTDQGLLVTDGIYLPSSGVQVRQTGLVNENGERMVVLNYMAKFQGGGAGLPSGWRGWTPGAEWNLLLRRYGRPNPVQAAAALVSDEVVQVSGSVSRSRGRAARAGVSHARGCHGHPQAGPYALALVDGWARTSPPSAFRSPSRPTGRGGPPCRTCRSATCCHRQPGPRASSCAATASSWPHSLLSPRTQRPRADAERRRRRSPASRGSPGRARRRWRPAALHGAIQP